MSRPIRAGPWRVDPIVRETVRRPLPVALVRMGRAIGAALDAAGAPAPASIGLVLSDDAELAKLNAVHLGVDGPTDVLSFPLLPPDVFPAAPGWTPEVPPPPGRRLHLGDIVVSVERAIAQAEAGRGGQTGDVRRSAADELLLLVTHGALHVCGWDHAEPADETAMRSLERRLLAG